MHCAKEVALPRSRSTGVVFAVGALMAALAACALVREARAQSSDTSPFQPALSDPRNPQRFGAMASTASSTLRPQSSTDVVTPSAADSTGATGFDSTGVTRKRKVAKRRPGEPWPRRSAPSAPYGAPQQVGGHTTAPQFAARAPYANAYRPPDALPRPPRPAPPSGDPFEPLGIRAGGFILRPGIEVTRAYDSNAERVISGSPSAYTMVAPELLVRSQWAVHELTATLRGNYSAYDSVATLNRPSADARVNGRIDATRDLRYDLEGRFLLGTGNPGSPNLQAGLARFPIYTTLGTTLGATQRFNRLELSVKGTFDRTVYQASHLTDGTTSSNDDRNYDQFGAAARASYELTPGVKPFVEIGADRRVHPVEFDRNGEQRDSRALTPKAGSTFELSRILTGEISLGYLMRDYYRDPTLPKLSGVVADASLVWVANGLTKVTLTANSRADETILAGVSGAFRRDGALQVDHAFRRWLIGTLKVGVSFDRYIGLDRNDTRTSLSAALTYKLNREVWLKGEYRNERLRSNVTGANYDANVWLLGLKLQR